MEKYRWSLEAENRTSFVQQCAVTFADMKVRLKGTCMDRQLQYHATGFCMKTVFIVHAFSSILLWELGGHIFSKSNVLSAHAGSVFLAIGTCKHS